MAQIVAPAANIGISDDGRPQRMNSPTPEMSCSNLYQQLE